MEVRQLADIFGYIAAAIGIVTFIPQAYQVYKTKNTKTISLLTFVLFDIGAIFWLTYGALLHAIPVLLVNLMILTLGTYIIIMKLKHH